MKSWPALACVLALGGGATRALAAPQQAAAATGEALPVEMVGAGTVSTPADEFGGALSNDGRTLYFDITAAPHYLYVLAASHLTGGKWGRPEVLPFSGRWRDSDPVLTPDGQTLLFASDRPLPGGADQHRFLIWAAQARRGGGWQEPQALPGAINSAGSQVFASVAANGNTYFTSNRKGGGYDVYRIPAGAARDAAAEDLGAAINGADIWTLEALVAPDESYLLLGSFGREPGYGNCDLYISFRSGAGWSQPKNLGPQVNTKAREYSPRISPDGEWLYFTSERGAQTQERERPWSSEEFTRATRGVTNGYGNIYRVPLPALLRSLR